MTVELSLRALAAVAWRDRLSPLVYRLARRLTDREATRQQKVGAIVDHMHREYDIGRPADPTQAETFVSPELLASGAAWHMLYPLDSDDACAFVAAAAMSVGIPCRLVAVRYGDAWTCRVDYEVGDHWETVDPLRRRHERDPDETVTGPEPKVTP